MSFRTRALWLLAFFVSETSLFLQIDYSDIENLIGVFSGTTPVIPQFDPNMLWRGTFLWLIIFLGLLFIVFSLFSVVCKSGVLSAIKDTQKKVKFTFGQKVKFGLSKFVPLFILELMFWLPNLIFFSIIFWSIWAELVAVTIIFTSLLFIYSLVVFLFHHFSYCYLVFENQKSWAALVAGWDLFIKNFKATFLVNLIKIGLGVVFGLASLVAVVLATVPFILLIFLFSLVLPWYVPFALAILGGLVALAVLFVIKGFKTAFFYTMLTKTYWLLKK
jgi:hypothetical protein